jgi:hypothetical protein
MDFLEVQSVAPHLVTWEVVSLYFHYRAAFLTTLTHLVGDQALE